MISWCFFHALAFSHGHGFFMAGPIQIFMGTNLRAWDVTPCQAAYVQIATLPLLCTTLFA